MTALTAPWDARAESAIRQTLRHRFAARATHPDWPEPVTLDVTDGTVTFDETWSPHVQADLTCALPADLATLDALDPRAGVRVQIDAGYVYPGGVVDVHQLVDLGLRARPVARPAQTMTLTAASDEALVQDAGPLLDDVLNAPAWDVGAAILARLPIPLGYTPTLLNTLPAPVPLAAYMDSRNEHWTSLKEWADAAAAQLFDRGDRTWLLRPWPWTAAQPVHLLKVGSAGTVLDSDATVTREDFANLVQITYEWTDPDGTPNSASGRAWIESGLYQGWNGSPMPGLKVYAERRTTQGTATQASAAAAAILTRRMRAAQAVTLTARAAWWVRPGMTVAVQHSRGPQELHLVTRVAYHLKDMTMTVTTRLPDDTPITTGV